MPSAIEAMIESYEEEHPGWPLPEKARLQFEGMSDRIADLEAQLAEAKADGERLKAVARLPILFYKPGPVLDADRAYWEAWTGSTEMTTKIMCDAIRAAIDAAIEEE